MNYATLRKAGMEYLETLNPKLWNDYNYHDPGITILEQLCYAITDLGYRTSYDMKDLLATDPTIANPTEEEIKAFFTAREILTCNPVTVDDYRKLVLDVEGVANVWLEKSEEQEQTIYADLHEEEITYDVPDIVAKTVDIKLNGLYKVLLEFSYSEEHGDLNDNTVTGELTVETGPLADLTIEVTVEFPYWDNLEVDWTDTSSIFENIGDITFDLEQEVAGFSIDFDELPGGGFQAQVFDLTSGLDPIEVPALTTGLTNLLQELIYNDDTGVLSMETGSGTLVETYQARIVEVQEVIGNVKARLHAHRNLCEDFYSLKSLRIEEIGLCGDIELKNDADVEEVAAELYYQVGRFLAPPIQFYTLSEMLTKTYTDANNDEQPYTTDLIFEGPGLDHGFLLNEELAAAVRRKTIHVSDLYNIIMDIEGVYAVKSLQVANFPQGDDGITQRSEEWCLQLAYDLNYVPRLSTEHSRIRFLKDSIPYLGNQEETEQLLEQKIADAGSGKPATKLDIDELDLAVPQGTWRNLEEYSSIQEQFPEVYGVGSVGLSPSSSDERKAQAQQLKGYLLHFDQLLANYLSQLGSIKELFSMNSTVKATYFSQPLYNLPHVQRLYKQFMEANSFEAESMTRQASEFNTAWADFINDESNALLTSLSAITESTDQFVARRSGFLDHLMARFAEQFTDYALVMHGITGKKESAVLNEDKLALLQNYPAISRDRGRAFNYKALPTATGADPIWDTENVSGFIKRLSRLVGIENVSRRDLYCWGELDVRVEEDTDGWYIRIYLETGEIIGDFGPTPSKEWAEEQVVEGKPMVLLSDSYQVIESTDGWYVLFLNEEGKETLTTSFFDTEARATEVAETLWEQFNPECELEGMHLVEHILLRPKHNDFIDGKLVQDDFLPVSLDPECYCSGTEDVWSFRASLILPYWPERFRNMDFRNHVERMARKEAPAHVALKICWIDQEQMRCFEEAWHDWLTENNQSVPDPSDLSDKLNTLINVLGALRNVYPSTTLHDCADDDDGSSPAMLGSARLGTF